MALLDVIIDILKINCSVVQCTGYASDIEALFYLFFFPTVFIILFIWVITGVITQQIGGKTGGLRILISVALYAFIVFQEYYTLFVSLSQLWWLLLATIVGLYIFIRKIIHGNGGGGGSPMEGIGGRGFQKRFIKRVKERARVPDLEDMRTANNLCAAVDSQFAKLNKEIAAAESLSGQAKSEQLKTVYEIDKDVNRVIDELDNFLDDHEELKNMPRFKGRAKKYYERLEKIRSGEKGLKKAA
jgi:hypothetical protein